MAANRRVFQRVELYKFIVEVARKDEKTFTGVEVVNISAGGLCFLTKFILNLGDQLDFRFPLKNRTIILPGRVVRVDGREAGIQFTCDQDMMIDFVDAYNEELHALTITKKEDSRLVLPGYEKSADKYAGLDDVLDPGPETRH
jgi:hypothetical protein